MDAVSDIKRILETPADEANPLDETRLAGDLDSVDDAASKLEDKLDALLRNLDGVLEMSTEEANH